MPFPELGKTTRDAGFFVRWQGDQEFSLGHAKFRMSARHPNGGVEKAAGDKKFSFREKFKCGHKLESSAHTVFISLKVDKISCSRIPSA